MNPIFKIWIARALLLITPLAVAEKKDDDQVIVFSRVGRMQTQPYPLSSERPATFRLLGEHPEAFCLTVREDGKTDVEFSPTATKGVYQATLRVACEGKMKSYALRGLATDKLEGKNEPPLHDVFRVLGVDADAGGAELHLNTRSAVIGSSIPAEAFRVAEGTQKVRITLIARYSPAGAVGFGFAMDDGEVLKEIGVLADSTRDHPDAHQRIYPPAQGETASFRGAPNFSITAERCPDRFGFYYAGKHYTSLTFPGKSKGARIQHTARVYPVSMLAGRSRESAYLICFEEAQNGDYQDLVFLVEGIEPAP